MLMAPQKPTLYVFQKQFSIHLKIWHEYEVDDVFFYIVGGVLPCIRVLDCHSCNAITQNSDEQDNDEQCEIFELKIKKGITTLSTPLL